MMRTIDTAMAKKMVEATAIHGASIIGGPGGWSVLLKLGLQEKPLGVQRGDKPRTWRSLDRCVAYLKSELKIDRVDLLDATHHSETAVARSPRADASARLRHAHASAAHDKWFRAQVGEAVKEADDPNAEWISNTDARINWAEQRAALVKLAKGRGA